MAKFITYVSIYHRYVIRDVFPGESADIYRSCHFGSKAIFTKFAFLAVMSQNTESAGSSLDQNS